MHNPGIGQVIVFALLLSQTFYNYHAIHERDHGYSTIGGIECGGGCETKKEEMVTLTRRIKGLWRCPLIDINVNE